MALFDAALVLIIIFLLFIIVYSRIMDQRMLDTLNEIKEFIKGIKQDGG